MKASRVIPAALILALAGASLAQSENKPKQPAAGAPLSGPSVTPRDVPGVDGQFGNSPDGLRRRLADRVPPRVMRQALGAVLGDDAADDVRATPEQREKIETIQKDFENQVREYVQTHRKELEELRDMMPGGGPAAEMLRRLEGNGGGDGAPARRRARAADGDKPGTPPPEAMNDQPARPNAGAPGAPGTPGERGVQIPPEARDRLRELMESMPQAEQSFTKVWQELTPKQREAVDARLNEFRERQSKQREEAYIKQRTGKTPEGTPEAQTPPPSRRRAADGARVRPEGGGDEMMTKPEPDRAATPTRTPREGGGAIGERRARLMRLFEQMTPEQQDQLLERLEGRMREGGVSPGGPRRPERGQPKPAPDMNEQPVPRPEEVEGGDKTEGKPPR